MPRLKLLARGSYPFVLTASAGLLNCQSGAEQPSPVPEEPVARQTAALGTVHIYGDPTGSQTISQPAGASLSISGGAGTFVDRMNQVRYADQFAGANAGERISAAIADLPAPAGGLPGGGIVDARGLQGAQYINVDVFRNVNFPGKLLLGETVYYVSTTQNVPSNWTVEGVRGGRLDGGMADGGTVFVWTGASAPVFRYLNTEFTRTVGVNINGMNVSGVTGVLVDSNNQDSPSTIPASHDNDFEDVHILDAPTGFQFGTRGACTPYGQCDQVDSWSVRNFTIVNNVSAAHVGIRIGSQNAGQGSVIERGFLAAKNPAGSGSLIDFQVAPLNLSIRNTGFSVASGNSTVALNLRYPGVPQSGGSPLFVEACGFEVSSTGYGIYVPPESDDSVGGTLVLVANQFANAPISVQGIRNISSIGNTFDSNPTVSDTASNVTSLHDTFTAGHRWVASRGIGTGLSVNGYGLAGDLSVGRSATTGALFFSTGSLAALDYGLNVPGTFWFSGGAVGIGNGMYSNAGGFKHKRGVATGSIAGGASATVTVAWSTAFANANYTTTCNVTEASAARTLSMDKIESQTSSQVVVRVFNSSGSSKSGTVGCIAVHD